jgi:hypothetical protein
MCSIESTVHYTFTVHSADNSADFRVFKKIPVPFAHQMYFGQFFLNFTEFFRIYKM